MSLVSTDELAPAARLARSAGLSYVNDDEFVYRRMGSGRAMRLRHASGAPVTDRRIRARVKRLVIPPAWTDVRIAASARGHIHAIGRDARGRKQYIYHPSWNAARDATKYDRLLDFARRLPRIRARVARDLARADLSKDHVLATVIRLLDVTHIRVGNEEYARANGSFGLTTLRDRHVRPSAGALVFEFRAKSGKTQCVRLTDRRLVRIVKACQELPGQRLFQYVDGGKRRCVTSGDVNAYLRALSGAEVTAKDFRTWAGTVLAGSALAACDGADASSPERQVAQAVKSVAASLGNTPAVCRKGYIHPAIINGHVDGTLGPYLARHAAAKGRATRGLNPREQAVLAYLSRAAASPGA